MEINRLLISIIVPIYNVEQYLSRCVDSLTHQTYPNIEIILIDDGSPDKCGAICDEYARRDKRVRVIHKSNGGLSDARNKGLDIAKGEYVMFVDSDDWIESETCKAVADCINNYNVDVVSFGIQLVGDSKIYDIQKVKNAGFVSSSEAVGSMIYRQREKGLLNYVCNKALKKSLKATGIFALDSVFYNYYQRGNSIMAGFYRPKALHDRISIWLKRYKFLCDNYPEYSDQQIAQVLGDVYIALIKLKGNTDYQDFRKEIEKVEITYKSKAKNLAVYSKKVKLHYYCYPLFWLYVKFVMTRG